MKDFIRVYFGAIPIAYYYEIKNLFAFMFTQNATGDLSDSKENEMFHTYC